MPGREPSPTTPSEAGFSTGRRKLLRGVGAATPVALTIASRPVMAGKCAPASSFASMNASRPTKTEYVCSGNLPSFWSQAGALDSWPLAPTTLFNNEFGATGGYADKTLLDVVSMPDGPGQDGLAPYVVAALLNAAIGATPGVLDSMLIKRIWRDVVTSGFFVPTAGIRWFPDHSEPAGTGGIKAWLQSTMGMT